MSATLPEFVSEKLEQETRAGNNKGFFDRARALVGMPEGERDDEIFKLACSLRGSGVPRELVEGAVLFAAGNCDPPFPADEALAKVESAFRYEQGGRASGHPAGVLRAGDTARGLGQPTPLAKLIKDGVEPPEELVRGILLAGRVTVLFGESGSGKSWLALWLALWCIRRGLKVLYLDNENGKRIMAERLEALGAETERLDDLLRYHDFPNLTLESEAVDSYLSLLDTGDYALVVFDSLINHLAACGLDENSPTDVARWDTTYAQPARARDVAVLILDHVPKNHNKDTQRGASRKKDAADVVWQVKQKQPFDRNTAGAVELVRKKDREGWLHENLYFHMGGTPNGFVIESTTLEKMAPPADENVLKPSQEKIIAALEKKGPLKARGLVKATGLSETTVHRETRDLILIKRLIKKVGGVYAPQDPEPKGEKTPTGGGSDGSPDGSVSGSENGHEGEVLTEGTLGAESGIDKPKTPHSQDSQNTPNGSRGSVDPNDTPTHSHPPASSGGGSAGSQGGPIKNLNRGRED